MGVFIGCVSFLRVHFVDINDEASAEKTSLINWITEKRPASTLKKYKVIVDEFLMYAQEKGLDPESDVALASFMRYAITERPRKLGRTTVCQIIPAAIRDYFQYSSGKKPLDSPLVRQTQRVVERETKKGDQDRSPLTMKMLRTMVYQMDTSVESIRNMFMVILMTFAFLRASEVVQLKLNDVKEENGDSLSVFIRKSKTDQAGDGATIDVAGTGTEICPVKWYHFFVKVRDRNSTYLFHQLGAGRKADKPLSPSTPNFVVKSLIKSIGIDPLKYGSHSCRKGGCTTALESGLTFDLLQSMDDGRVMQSMSTQKTRGRQNSQ